MVLTECVFPHTFILLITWAFLLASYFYEVRVADLGSCHHTITHINCFSNYFRHTARIVTEIADFSVLAKSAGAKSLKTIGT